MKQNINVTEPFLPPLEEFVKYLETIWKRKILTNGGPYHQQLESELCNYLGVKYISLFSNGTLALMIALNALKLSGEIVTTPFSFVATTHALWWNNIKPVFTDIEPGTFNLDPDKIEAAITPKTTAILPVHVYGNPCNVERIGKIANRYGLKLIYDAAHAFGTKINGTSVADYGDLTVLSFHATKVFNTFEGGAIISHDEKTKEHINQLKNFGITDETTVVSPGINAKMNEFQAALGILQLKYVDEAVSRRKLLTEIYREALKGVTGITFQHDLSGVTHNYAYFPVLIDPVKFGRTRDDVYNELRKSNIFSRRYFYPLISQFPTYRGLDSAQPGKMTVAEKITEEILCLPIYPDLEISTVNTICDIVKSLRK
jgi:dTDP-4-amino-4,6-dideoxygalactose transaminase